MHKQEVTIYDVAREAKVSMATVSRVVNGNNNVRKETRDRVMEVINRLHYQPNAVAQGLASKRTTTVGIIVPDLTNLYFAELSKGIDDIATLYKYNIILSSTENKLLKEDQVIQGLLNKQVDGVIYMGDRLSDEAAAAFERTNTPVVLAGTIDSREQFASVNIDYQKSDKEALTLLLDNGCKEIALILADDEASINKENRIRAYQEFAEENNLTKHIYQDIYSYQDGYDLYGKLEKDGIDAALVTRNLSAVGIMNAALDDGKKIPDDLELITSNATAISEVVRPSLTNIKQPLYDIGAVAMRMLTKLMANEELDEQHMVMPYELVEKGSTSRK